MHNSIGALISDAGARFAEKTALVYEGRSYSFQELHVLSSNVAHSMADLGIGKGDIVSLYSPNCPEWIIAYYAILKLGAIVNPLNLMLTPSEAAYALGDCGAVAVLGSTDKLEGLAPYIESTKLKHRINFNSSQLSGCLSFETLLSSDGSPEVYPIRDLQQEDVSTIGYTSGTTGHPKGAVLSHKAILMNVAMTATMHVRNPSDTVVSSLPLSHVYGNVVMNSAMAYGMKLILHKTFDAEQTLLSIQEHRASVFEGVPTMYMYLLEHPKLRDYDLSSLTRCTVGGQTMPLVKMEQVEAALGCRLLELWGMTELGGLGVTHSMYGPRKLGSAGIPLPHVQARIVCPEAGTVLATDQVGELQIRGPITMIEYLGKASATHETIDNEGWLRTGDLARIDKEGYIYVVDRLKDMIITAGFNVYPAELERVIAEHPSVAMVAVGGIPDDAKGELAKAYIVTKNDIPLDVKALELHCRSRLAAYKVPRAYQQVRELPKTSTGKIVRRLLETHCR
ncbi:class I adenylate-forming enzyme family protein [Pseudomonas sp. BGr12]|uniref:class I adenylate-forming enzyme family protein n=1 Tax=Pseudomonas sp. BGr12 TaxID=2936269 RepID=UPI002559F51E|nr:AMP-binding protein [Pseudomonas sp. BJa5]MDL2428429.1 AMP-binding protein [Pseudomonas sp. BJa5]